MRWQSPTGSGHEQDPTLPSHGPGHGPGHGHGHGYGDDPTWASATQASGPGGGATGDLGVLAAGAEVARYQILGLLGAGGMGAVYRAYDPQLARPVALKLLQRVAARAHDDSSTHAAQQRLLREAQAMAQVAHPNLVMVFEVGAHEGHIYLAMEYVEGTTLRGWLDHQPRPVAEILRVFGEAGQGLAAAHRAGLVHRDFKPANVLVSTAGRVQVTDFGLARASGAVDALGQTRPPTDALAVDLTQTGAIMGTPAYMAPEQFEGGPTDPRTDQFAFCVALYEALFGRRPFSGQTGIEIMSAVLAGRMDPVPPRPGVSRGLVTVLQRGLARDPQQRFADMDALLDALRAAARPPQRVGLWLGLGAFVLVVGVAGAFAWAKLSAPEPIPAAAATPTPTPEPGLDPTPPPEVDPKPEVEPPPALVEPEAGLATLAAYHAIRGFRASGSTWTAAEKDFRQACEQDGAPDRWCAAAEVSAGMGARLDDDHGGAHKHFTAAIGLDPTWALPRVGRAMTRMQLGQLDDALDDASEARRLEPEWVQPLRVAADVHLARGEYGKAVAELRTALELQPELPELMSELALAYHVQGLDSEAVRYAEKALALDEDQLSALILLAERALELGDDERALELANRATAVSSDSVPGWLARADALARLGPREQAEAAYAKAVELAAANPEHGADPSRVAAAKTALAAGELPVPALSPVPDTPEPTGGRSHSTPARPDEGKRSHGGGSKKPDNSNGNIDDLF